MTAEQDRQILAAIDAAFACIERPPHFTDWQHCCECAEHDALLCSRDRTSLQLEDVNNPGWDPLCFCTAQGLAWYFPALAHLMLCGPQGPDWYGNQLLFHLGYAGSDNRLWRYCDQQQRAAIAALLEHCVNTRCTLVSDETGLLLAWSQWSSESPL